MVKNAKALYAELESYWSRADREQRDLTYDERSEVEHLLGAIRSQKAIDDQLAQFGGPYGDLVGQGVPYAQTGGDPGARFVQSAGFKAIADPQGRSQQWSSGLIDVGTTGYAMKGTLLESAGGGATALVSVPQVAPGVVQKLFQALTFENLISSQPAIGPTVRYMVEGTATSGAAGVAEGGDKPQSILGFTSTDEPIKKVATSIITSDEFVEDLPAMQTFVNSRLSLFVQIEVERQLLRGASGGNEVQGLLTGRGVPVYAGGTSAGNRAEQLFKAANGVRGSAFVEPESFVVHPTDWEAIRLLKDTAGNYLGGGPWGAYGNPLNVAASGQATGAADSLWNKAVYVTSAIGSGTALVGSSQSACVWNRGNLRVEATNSHSDLFLKDMVAIRAERRLGLTVYRSGGFCEVRLA